MTKVCILDDSKGYLEQLTNLAGDVLISEGVLLVWVTPLNGLNRLVFVFFFFCIPELFFIVDVNMKDVMFLYHKV